MRCKRDFCSDCGIINQKGFRHQMCKECVHITDMKKMKKKIIMPLTLCQFNSKIISLISSYAIGFIVKCSNKHCQADIHVNNWFDFQHNIECEGRVFHKYHVERHHANYYYRGTFHHLHGDFWRIFCAQCKQTKLKKCTFYSDCRNYDLTKCCKDHSFCMSYPRKIWKYAQDTPYKCNMAGKCCYVEDVNHRSGTSRLRCVFC